ncbi:hypothetical protein [uncultured Sphingomonas sp.]|uniref:glycosyltransferase family 39 protein n=1 Tax=uncultured Sphingomonas sp. TaxID=158754 RepID=UPI0025DCF8FF|nr:hypothetical protein [uncultured Sphingomonas sp.]
MDMRRRLPVLLLVTGILVAALGLRLWKIGGEPLWLDEAYSAYAAEHGFAFLWQMVPRYETHPPVYYSLVRIWTLPFGNGLVALRMLGIVAGLATLPVLAWGAHEAARLLRWDAVRARWLALAAFGLGSVSIAMVEMARQVRPYPVMILTYAAATALLIRLARRRAAGLPIGGRGLVAYLLLVESMLWLHNLDPLYAVALTLALAIGILHPGLSRRDWAWLLIGHVAVALAYLPGLLILAGQAPTWIGTTWLRFGFTPTFFARVATLYAAQGWPVLPAALLAGMAVAVLARQGDGKRLAAMLLVLALLPLASAIGISVWITPVFITRTMTPVAAPAMLLLAIGAVGWSGGWLRIGIAAAVMLGGAMFGAGMQVRQAGPMENWYGTIAWLQRYIRPGDVIFAYPNEGALPLAFALRDKGLAYPIRPIPGPVPSFAGPGAYYPTGSRGVVSLSPARLHAIAQAPDTRAVPTIWLLRLGASGYDPGDVFFNELHRGRYVVRWWKSDAIDLVGLRRRPAPARNRR